MNNNAKRETLKSEWTIPKHVNKTLIEPQSINLSFAETQAHARGSAIFQLMQFKDFRRQANDNTLENDLHREANFDVSSGDISAMLHPSEEALAVLPLLWT